VTPSEEARAWLRSQGIYADALTDTATVARLLSAIFPGGLAGWHARAADFHKDLT